MAKGSFFDNQSDLTATKIKIYEKYICGYLPKVLMTYKNCFIADLFCGAGKNGKAKGSPLILLDTAEYILTSPVLKKKEPKIFILFNDKDKNNIQNLNQELVNFKNDLITIFPPKNENFQTILPDLLKILEKQSIKTMPKFFFLDPFTYSDIFIENLKQIMNLEHTEILLFVPVFHSYRFASDKKMKIDHKTRKFIEAFTKKGIFDYGDIDSYMQSMKEKLKEELQLKYVRPVLLDGGKSKNALFLLTKNQKGILCMNKVALGESEDGQCISTKNQKTLFGLQETQKFRLFKSNFLAFLKQQKNVTNKEIVEFTTIEGYLPKHALEILKNLQKDNKIRIVDENKNTIKSSSNWNIAEDISKNTTFIFNE